MTRTLIFGGDTPLITCNVAGSARRHVTVTCRFPTSIQHDTLCMDVPGGIVSRPCARHFHPTFWPFQRFAHVRDAASGRGFAITMGPPATISADGSGLFDFIVTRNAPLERAFGFLPIPAHPASGPDPGPQSVSFAVCFTDSGGWLENRDIGESSFLAAFEGEDPAAGREEAVLIGDDRPRVIALKRASRGKGVILRLFSPVPVPTPFTLSLRGRRIRSALLCDARERDIAAIPVSGGKARVSMDGAIVTLRLMI